MVDQPMNAAGKRSDAATPRASSPASLLVLRLGRAYARLLDALAALSGAMILFAMVIVTLDVVLRGVSGGSLAWSFEVTEFILLYAPFLSMAWLARRRGHIVVDMVVTRLPPSAARWTGVGVALFVAALCLFLTWWGGIATWDSFERDIRNAGVVDYPRWALLVTIPVCFALTAVEYLRIAVLDAREA